MLKIESTDDTFENAKITFEADVSTINTHNNQRDAHLRTTDFFDVENHPKITFVSTGFKKLSESRYELTGDFQMRGITKPITLIVEFNGKSKGFDNMDVAGFEITGKINRFDYGIQFNALTEAGGIVVGPDVKLEILAEMKEVSNVSIAA